MKPRAKYQLILLISLIISILLVIITFVNPSFFGKITNIIRYITLVTSSFLCSIILISEVFVKSGQKLSFLERKMDLWNNISYRVKNAGETTFNAMPLGIIVFDDDFVIEWANNYAKKAFNSSLVERTFNNLDKEFSQLIESRQPSFEYVIYGKVYLCQHSLRDHVIYMTDITDQNTIKNRYQKRMLALGILNLDNLDLATANLDAQEKALHMSNLIGILTNWASESHVSLRGYTEERYMLIMDHQILDDLMKKQFSILVNIKEYCDKENIRITASIGLACLDVNAVELMDIANEQLELALNRGGNQAVVKIDDDVFYFGAKSEAFEVRTPIYIRVKWEELLTCVSKASNVLVMSHKEMDADAFGACLAAKKLVETTGKDVKIIFEEEKIDETVNAVYDNIKLNYANLLDNFIKPMDAKIDENTLLIIVDCQYSYLVMNEKIFKKVKHLAIIDHHRRNTEAINQYDFLYTQPSASSSVEMILEMFEYVEKNDIEISEAEATWMLMGIVVDTNNFVYRSTHRTFHVLAKLQEYGAEMAKVQRFLRENFEEYVKKIAILNNLEFLDGGYGIATCDDQIYERAFLAKIADNVISVNNIKVAFCIGCISKDAVGISARSLDEVNVQLIMEKLGGGGHFNNAATQINNCTIQEAKEKLIQVLKTSDFKEGESMKVILIKDVKGKGKVNDIIEVPSGHANYLIHEGQAIPATPNNIKQLEMEKTKEKKAQEKHFQEMQELKEKVERLTVKVQVKVGANGKLFGSVSTKEIVEEFKNQNNIELDKKKIIYDKTIDALGTYVIPIQLHKEVIANITLYVVEAGAKK